MEPPAFPPGERPPVRAAPGASASLFLPLPTGTPPYHFEWSRAGASLDDRFRSAEDTGGVRLSVSAARTGDSGVYTLQATNAAGKDTARVRLEVSPDEAPTGDDPPAFLRRLQDLTVKVGTRTRFLVEIVSSTECKVTWYRNERRLMEAERVALVRDGTFWCADIAAVSVDDTGRWTCTAENAGGRASCSAHLNVLVPKAYKRPEFVEELRALLTEQGTVSLECKVVGVPTPVLRWFKDSREIKAGDVFALTANAEDPTSLGTYTCEAVNCMGRAYSSSKVHVVGRGSREGSARPITSGVALESPPIFTKELEDKFVRISEPLNLSCHIVVPPWPRSVVWYNKEGKVEPGDRYHVVEDGVGGYLLEVPSAEWPDEGEWKCVATSAGGRIGFSSCFVSMEVPKNYRKPRFMENLQAVLTEEGLVSFECKVVGFPTPVLSWFKDGQELKPGDVYQLTGTNSLGSYCCIARNCMGQASSSAELTVEDIQNQLNEEEKLQLFSKNQAPKFIQGLKSVEAKIDEPFRFTIKVAIPPEPSLQWYRDDQPVDDSSRCNHGKEERGVFYLDIQGLEFLDQAEWKCVAVNDFGHSVTSCFLKLVIPRHYKKPRFLENLQAILSDEGAVNLECKVIGVPQPVLKWYKDGEELKPGDIHRIISGQDGTCCLGTYTCEAQNCMGIAASSASLLGFDDSMKAKATKKKAEEQALQRNVSLSTIHEERSSQMYDTPVGDITLDDKAEISFSFDGKEVSVSLYETPDLTEEDAIQIMEMYADQISENVTEHNVAELPPLRFVKETSTSGNLLMEAIIIDVSPDYFASPEEDLRTEADVEDISIADENGPPQLSLDLDIGGEDYLEKTMDLLSHEKADIMPRKLSRKKSDSQRSADDYFSLSLDQTLSEDKKDDETQIFSESFASARSLGKPKSKSSKPSLDDGQESSDVTKTMLFKDEVPKINQPGTPIVKPKRERRSSRSSRRSSSGSEKSFGKSKEDPIRTQVALELTPKIPAITHEDFKSRMSNVSSSLSKVINNVQIIERDIILKSELMSSAATASRSLEIISSLVKPLSEIHSIADAARESTIESKEVCSTLFNNLPQPLKVLQQSLTIVEKCIDVESDNKTLVKKTCVAFIETCGEEVKDLLNEITSITDKGYLSTDLKTLSEINVLVNDMTNVIRFSADTIKARNLLSEASEIKLEDTSVESKHLRDTQKAVFELKSPLNSLLRIVNTADSGKLVDLTKVKSSEVILNDMSASVQDLQAALEQIETLSVKESTTSLHKYNTEIIETVMESVLKLRSSFEQLSTDTKIEEDEDLLKQTLKSINNNLNEISSHIEMIENNVGSFDILQSDNKLEMLQRMAQILISLENNLPRLETMTDVKAHMDVFHKNLTRVLENVIESNEAPKYFTLMDICDAVNRVNTSIKNMDTDSILSLASLSNALQIIQNTFVKNVFEPELNCSILSNITDVLLSIQEALNHADEISLQMESDQIQDIATPMHEINKASIVYEHIDHTIAVINTVKSIETTQELKNSLLPALESICPILEELKRCIAAIKPVDIPEEEHVLDISDASFVKTIASPLLELNQNVLVLNQVIIENIESFKENNEIMTAIAEPLHELHTTLQILQQDVISQYGEDIAPYDVSINIASAVQNLQSCIVMIQEQPGIEGVDEMSTLEDISGIKTTADTIPSDRLVLPAAEETAVELSTEPFDQDVVPSATAQALHTLNEHITVLQNPEVLDALDTLSEVSDYSSLKSVALGLGELHAGIEEILHPFVMENSSDILNLINTSKLAAIAEPMQELHQSLSVLDTSNIPIYVHILEIPTEKIHSVLESISDFKKYLIKCIQVLFPAMETADKTIEISNKVEALREVCENLKLIIETTKNLSPKTPVKREVIMLEETVDSLLSATDVTKGIQIQQVKAITEELFEKIMTVQEDLIQYTPHTPEKLLEEAKLIQAIDEIENNIAVLEQYDFVDLSRASDMTSCGTPTMAMELESEPLVQMDDILQNAVNVLQDSTQETPMADLMILEDFFKTCKSEFTIIRLLISKSYSPKKIIRLIQEFTFLQSLINDFKTNRPQLRLSNDIDGYLKIFFLEAGGNLKVVQNSLLKLVTSQSESLFTSPMLKLENTQEELKTMIKNSETGNFKGLIDQFISVVDIAKPILQTIEIDVTEELKHPSVQTSHPDTTAIEEKLEILLKFAEENSVIPQADERTKDALIKISTCIQKHQDYREATGNGKNLIILKCLSECADILQASVLEKKELITDKLEDNILKAVLTEMLEPLQALHSQLVNIQEQVASGIEEKSVSVDITSTESMIEAVSEIHREIVQQVESAKSNVDSENISLIKEADKEIHAIQDTIRSLENIPVVRELKEVTKPIEEVEKSLHEIMSTERADLEITEKLVKEKDTFIEQYTEIIDIVEEISATIKVEELKESVAIARQLLDRETSCEVRVKATDEVEQVSAHVDLASQLQNAVSTLSIQVCDFTQDLSSQLNPDLLKRYIECTNQLQNDLAVVTGEQAAVAVLPKITSEDLKVDAVQGAGAKSRELVSIHESSLVPSEEAKMAGQIIDEVDTNATESKETAHVSDTNVDIEAVTEITKDVEQAAFLTSEDIPLSKALVSEKDSRPIESKSEKIDTLDVLKECIETFINEDLTDTFNSFSTVMNTEKLKKAICIAKELQNNLTAEENQFQTELSPVQLEIEKSAQGQLVQQLQNALVTFQDQIFENYHQLEDVCDTSTLQKIADVTVNLQTNLAAASLVELADASGIVHLEQDQTVSPTIRVEQKDSGSSRMTVTETKEIVQLVADESIVESAISIPSQEVSEELDYSKSQIVELSAEYKEVPLAIKTVQLEAVKQSIIDFTANDLEEAMNDLSTVMSIKDLKQTVSIAKELQDNILTIESQEEQGSLELSLTKEKQAKLVHQLQNALQVVQEQILENNEQLRSICDASKLQQVADVTLNLQSNLSAALDVIDKIEGQVSIDSDATLIPSAPEKQFVTSEVPEVVALEPEIASKEEIIHDIIDESSRNKTGSVSKDQLTLEDEKKETLEVSHMFTVPANEIVQMPSFETITTDEVSGEISLPSKDKPAKTEAVESVSVSDSAAIGTTQPVTVESALKTPLIETLTQNIESYTSDDILAIVKVISGLIKVPDFENSLVMAKELKVIITDLSVDTAVLDTLKDEKRIELSNLALLLEHSLHVPQSQLEGFENELTKALGAEVVRNVRDIIKKLQHSLQLLCNVKEEDETQRTINLSVVEEIEYNLRDSGTIAADGKLPNMDKDINTYDMVTEQKINTLKTSDNNASSPALHDHKCDSTEDKILVENAGEENKLGATLEYACEVKESTGEDFSENQSETYLKQVTESKNVNDTALENEPGVELKVEEAQGKNETQTLTSEVAKETIFAENLEICDSLNSATSLADEELDLVSEYDGELRKKHSLDTIKSDELEKTRFVLEESDIPASELDKANTLTAENDSRKDVEILQASQTEELVALGPAESFIDLSSIHQQVLQESMQIGEKSNDIKIISPVVLEDNPLDKPVEICSVLESSAFVEYLSDVVKIGVTDANDEKIILAKDKPSTSEKANDTISSKPEEICTLLEDEISILPETVSNVNLTTLLLNEPVMMEQSVSLVEVADLTETAEPQVEQSTFEDKGFDVCVDEATALSSLDRTDKMQHDSFEATESIVSMQSLPAITSETLSDFKEVEPQMITELEETTPIEIILGPEIAPVNDKNYEKLIPEAMKQQEKVSKSTNIDQPQHSDQSISFQVDAIAHQVVAEAIKPDLVKSVLAVERVVSETTIESKEDTEQIDREQSESVENTVEPIQIAQSISFLEPLPESKNALELALAKESVSAELVNVEKIAFDENQVTVLEHPKVFSFAQLNEAEITKEHEINLLDSEPSFELNQGKLEITENKETDTDLGIAKIENELNLVAYGAVDTEDNIFELVSSLNTTAKSIELKVDAADVESTPRAKLEVSQLAVCEQVTDVLISEEETDIISQILELESLGTDKIEANQLTQTDLPISTIATKECLEMTAEPTALSVESSQPNTELDSQITNQKPIAELNNDITNLNLLTNLTSEEKFTLPEATHTIISDPTVHLPASSLVESEDLQLSTLDVEGTAAKISTAEQTYPLEETANENIGICQSIASTQVENAEKPRESEALMHHIDTFISEGVLEAIEELAAAAESSDLIETVKIAKDSLNSISAQSQPLILEETGPLVEESQLQQAELKEKLHQALSSLQVKVLDATQELSPTPEMEKLKRLSEAVMHLQNDLKTAASLRAESFICEIPTESAKEDSMKQLENLLQEVSDKLDLSVIAAPEDNDALRDSLDEVQTVIIKLKRDFDGANDTLNETLEDLECSVRSVQLQINEDSPPDLLKEACATLQLLVNNMSETGETCILESVSKEIVLNDILERCSNETEETIQLIEIASNVDSKDRSKLGAVVSSLNNLKDTIKSLRTGFTGNADTLIEKGTEIVQNLNQIEDKVFSIERELEAIDDLSPTLRDNIVAAVHAVYGSISNMRSTVSSTQKQYMFENYGKPSENLLRSIKNLSALSVLLSEAEKAKSKKICKSLRNVLNHFEDIKFYINLDKTARLPSDAAFTKIILEELKSNLNIISSMEIISTDVKTKIDNALKCVVSSLDNIEARSTLEVKEKIPMYKHIASEVLDATIYLRNDLEKKKLNQEQLESFEDEAIVKSASEADQSAAELYDLPDKEKVQIAKESISAEFEGKVQEIETESSMPTGTYLKQLEELPVTKVEVTQTITEISYEDAVPSTSQQAREKDAKLMEAEILIVSDKKDKELEKADTIKDISSLKEIELEHSQVKTEVDEKLEDYETIQIKTLIDTDSQQQTLADTQVTLVEMIDDQQIIEPKPGTSQKEKEVLSFENDEQNVVVEQEIQSTSGILLNESQIVVSTSETSTSLAVSIPSELPTEEKTQKIKEGKNQEENAKKLLPETVTEDEITQVADQQIVEKVEKQSHLKEEKPNEKEQKVEVQTGEEKQEKAKEEQATDIQKEKNTVLRLETERPEDKALKQLEKNKSDEVVNENRSQKSKEDKEQVKTFDTETTQRQDEPQGECREKDEETEGLVAQQEKLAEKVTAGSSQKEKVEKETQDAELQLIDAEKQKQEEIRAQKIKAYAEKAKKEVELSNQSEIEEREQALSTEIKQAAEIKPLQEIEVDALGEEKVGTRKETGQGEQEVKERQDAETEGFKNETLKPEDQAHILQDNADKTSIELQTKLDTAENIMQERVSYAELEEKQLEKEISQEASPNQQVAQTLRDKEEIDEIKTEKAELSQLREEFDERDRSKEETKAEVEVIKEQKESAISQQTEEAELSMKKENEKVDEQATGKEKLEREKQSENKRLEKDKLEEEIIEREKLALTQLNKESLQQEQLETEKLEQEQLEEDKLKQETQERKKLEQQQVEKENLEVEKLQQEQIEKHELKKSKLGQEKLKEEQLEKEKSEQDKVGAENHDLEKPLKRQREKELLEEEKKELEKLVKAKQEQETLKQEKLQREKQEQDKLEKETLELERIKKEKQDKEDVEKQLDKEKQDREQQEKQKQQEEKEKLDKERLVKEKLEKEKLEQEKQAQDKLNEEMLEKERLDKEKLAKDKLEQEKQAQDKLNEEMLEKERLDKEKLAKDKLEQEKQAQDKLEKEKIEKERLDNEKLEKDKLEQEKQAQDKLNKEKLEKERLDKEKLEQEKRAQDKLDKENQEEEKREQEKQEQEKLEQEKVEREKRQKAKLEEEKREQEKQEQENLKKKQLKKEKVEQKDKLARDKQEQEKLEREKQEKVKLEKEKLEQEELEKERLEKERQEKEKQQLEKAQLQKEKEDKENLKKKQLEEAKLEKEKLESEKQEKEKQQLEEVKLEKEQLEKEKLEQARLEKERLDNEKQEQEKLEKEKQDQEKLEQAKLEKERLDNEKQEQEKLEKEKREQDKLEQAKLEKERRDNEKQEQEKLEKEKQEQDKLEEEKQAQQEKDRLEELEKTRLEQEKLDKEKLEKEKQEKKKLKKEKLEKEKLKQEKLEREKVEREKQEQERLKNEKLEKEQLEEAKLHQEKISKEKAEKERVENEKLEQVKLEREKQELAKLERQKQEQEKLEKEQLEKAKLEQEKLEKIEKEKFERAKLEKEKLEKENLEKAKLEKIKQEQEILEKQKLEQDKLEQEKRKQEEELKQLEKEKLEKEERDKEKQKQDQLEQEKREQEEEIKQKKQLEKEKQEQEEREKQKQEQDRLEKEQLEQEKQKREQEELEKEKKRIEKEKLEEEKLEMERQVQDKLDKEKLEKEKRKKVKLEKMKLAKEKREKENLEKERLEKEKQDKENLEKEKLEKEKRDKEKEEKERIEIDKKAKEDEQARIQKESDDAEKAKKDKKLAKKLKEQEDVKGKSLEDKRVKSDEEAKKQERETLEFESHKINNNVEEVKKKSKENLDVKKRLIKGDEEEIECDLYNKKHKRKDQKIDQDSGFNISRKDSIDRISEIRLLDENGIKPTKETSLSEETYTRKLKSETKLDRSSKLFPSESPHYIKEYHYEPSARPKHEDREKPRFIDHNHRDYTMEFARPSAYREKTLEVDNVCFEKHTGAGHIYKANSLMMEAQLRSSAPPRTIVPDASRSSEPVERRSDVKHRSKALSEARSILTEKRTASRDVRRKPVFSTYLTDRTAVEASRVKLTCSVLSSADPKVTWYKNGVLLDNKLKYRTKLTDGLITLEVLNAVPSDSAEYSCTVENENGSVSSSANLKVYPSFEASPIPPTFTRSIRDTYHLAENELVLECRIRGQPLPTISWFKDDQPVSANERYQAYYLADGVCRLAISHPTPADSGKYTCKAENSVWSDQITHVVNFTGKESRLSPNLTTIERSRFNRQALESSRRPHFGNVLTDYKVARGGTIGLQVEIRGAPTRVEWLREGRSVTETYTNAKTYVEQGLYTLALSDVTERESGMYTCRAWSSHGTVDMNAAITVVQPNELEGKPAIIAGRPEKDVLISVGEDLNISFRVQGEPKPKVIFMKGIRDITNSQRVCKMTSDDYVKFTVKRSVISDAGTYCILARNAYGCDRAFVTAVVRQRASSENLISDWTYPTDEAAVSLTDRRYKSVPERIPGEPSVVDGGSNWLSIGWPKSDPQDIAPVLAYKVESWLVGKEGGARWTELGITPLNTFDAFNLKQGEEYHFRVTPRNRYGWGEPVQTSSPIGIGLAGDRPEFVDILPGQLKVLLGQTANLCCSVKGKPIPEVIWMKNGHEIEEEDARLKTSFNGFNCSLTIDGINTEDEARYSCEASNEHGRSSTYARLAVVTDRLVWEADAKLKRERSADADWEYPPQFTMRLRDRRVQATYPVRLTCQVVGSPPPTVTWYKDGEEVYLDSRHTKSQDEHFHTLEIAPTTLEDGGVYEAMARNGSGAISCRCSLVVDKGIRAYVAPEFCCGLEPLYRLNEGDELRISAVVEAYPTVGVTWYRDGVRLRPSRRAIMTLDRDGQTELALAFVTPRDAGVYSCTASNEVGRATTSGKVEVIEGDAAVIKKRTPPVVLSPDVPYSKEPMFIRKPRSSEAQEGDTVIIQCEVVGDPKPDVYWLRDFLKPDYYRDATHFKRVDEGPEYRFEIPHAKLDYTGAYSVVARNVHGEAKAIISLQILAKDPNSTEEHYIRYGRVDVIPRFEKNLTDLLCHDGDAIEFECHVSGHPEPDIRWFHYSELIRECSDFEWSLDNGTARLKIKQVTAEDEGTYLCEASNNLGKAASSACLVVYPPGEPNTLSQRLRRPPALLSAASTPRSTPRSTPARSVSRTPGPDPRRLCSPSRQMAPKFYTYPFNKVVEEGDTVVFQCAVKGLPAPWATWDKDGVIITPSSRITIREKDEILRILEVEEVTIEDVGTYRITIENDYGRVEASARLEVLTQKGKFYTGVRAYSPSPRKSLTYRRRSRQD